MMAGVDQINALPQDVKISILSHLPITDAIRTSALSRSWRHLWTHLPGFSAYETLGRASDRPNDISRWIESVHHIISSLRGPIKHLTLRHLGYGISEYSWRIEWFLDMIFEKGDLEILFVHMSSRFRLPYFHSLTSLFLNHVTLYLPTDFCGLDHLTDLYLDKVRISQQDIQLLIDRSKKLRIVRCRRLVPSGERGSLSVTVNCPLLELIEFNFCPLPRLDARVVSAPCLKTAYVNAIIGLDLPLEQSAWVATAILRFMADIARVSFLSLNSVALLCLSRVDVPHTLWEHFHQLRWLKFVQFFPIDRMYKILFCLLRSMPSLESLEIKCDYLPLQRPNGLDPIPLNECTKKHYGFRCLDQTLRRVAISMDDLTEINDFMWMMRFILSNANGLQVIKIEYSMDDAEVKPRIFKELREVEKASLDAQVVFVDKGC